MKNQKKSCLSPCSIVNRKMGDKEYIEAEDPYKQIGKKRLLLHSCCGPCSTSVVERLVEEYNITVFFYNPNITDKEEYCRRRDSQIEFIEAFNRGRGEGDKVKFMEGPYDPESFYQVATFLEDAPEGGKRCGNCFRLRLETTAQNASIHGFDTFTTTLSVSPHKDYNAITDIGKRMAVMYGVGYLDMDFKKKAGFQRSIELSTKYKLYRQTYCGCQFSVRKPEAK